VMSGARFKLLPALLVALALNAVLLASAAMLSRERPVRQDISDPVAVNLISLKETPPPPEEKPREIPKPEPKPELDFMPELIRPSLNAPAMVGVKVAVDPSLFQGGLPGGDFIFNSGDLDHPPQAVVRTQPVYPYRARQRNISGEVKIKLLVLADGSVAQVEILSARPEGVFDDTVLKAVPQWRFRPGVIDGRQVPSWVITTVRFDLGQ
jgi:protein TonB